jgi:hypothetical protein
MKTAEIKAAEVAELQACAKEVIGAIKAKSAEQMSIAWLEDDLPCVYWSTSEIAREAKARSAVLAKANFSMTKIINFATKSGDLITDQSLTVACQVTKKRVTARRLAPKHLKREGVCA